MRTKSDINAELSGVRGKMDRVRKRLAVWLDKLNELERREEQLISERNRTPRKTPRRFV